MAFTYTASSIGSHGADWIRFMIGDKYADRVLLDDAEIAAMIAEYGSGELALVPCCRAALAAARQMVDTSAGQVDEKWSQRVSALEATLAELEAKYGDSGTEDAAPTVIQLTRGDIDDGEGWEA